MRFFSVISLMAEQKPESELRTVTIVSSLRLTSMKKENILKNAFKTDAFSQVIERSASTKRNEAYFARYLHFQNKLMQQIDNILKSPIL